MLDQLCSNSGGGSIVGFGVKAAGVGAVFFGAVGVGAVSASGSVVAGAASVIGDPGFVVVEAALVLD